jgi:hypothetical protein
MRLVFSIVFLLAWLPPALAQVEATTASGEKVVLLPNGRWEYADQKKAEVQREAARAERERERSAQGGLFGIGRTIQPGDKDYNRGSLKPR